MLRIIWLFLALPLVMSGQNIETIGKENPLLITGGVSINQIFYAASGINSRRAPYSYYASGNVNFSLYGWNVPLNFSLSNHNVSYQQPFNQYGFHPTYKWITSHVGYSSMSFSPYTLNGHLFNGIGVDLAPGEKFRFSAMYGRLLKAVEPDSLSEKASVPAFKRMGYGFKAHYGDAKYFGEISMFHAKDDTTSIEYVPEDEGILPQENLVISISGGVTLFQKLLLKAEFANSALTRDTRTSENNSSGVFNLVGPLFIAKTSTSSYKAIKSNISYSGNGYNIGAGYERIDPEYTTFELSTDFNQDIMQLYNKSKELESRYSFALFSADVSAEVAQASGLYLRDTDVRKGERYLYRVYSKVPQSLIPSDTGFVFLGLEDFAPLPEIKEVKVQFGDRLSMISWSTRYLQSFYSAYWVERSLDGKIFKRITELPYVNVYPENVTDPGTAYKLDSLSENKKTYHYRVSGISPFGETGPPSEVVKGEGEEALGVAPAIRKIVSVNGQVILHWEFPKEKESAINGFAIERSRSSDNGYKMISPLLPLSDRSFRDPEPEGTNYYRVKAIGKGGEKSFSFPALHQLEDSIPPLQPTGLIGFVDTTGVVTLHWNQNNEEDLSGYRVFRSNFQNSEFSQVTSSPVDTTEFKEKISLQNLTREMYYKIQAIDTRFNPSGYSKIVKLLKPDVVPPVAPVIKGWKTSGDMLSLNWISSPSTDIAKYNLKMKRVDENTWGITQSFTTTDKMQYEYTGLKTGSFEFIVEAADSSGNTTPSKVLKANITGGIRKSIQNIKAIPNRAEKKIVLTWKYDKTNVDKILIYRHEGNDNVTLYKSISGDLKQFVDERVKINTEYGYFLKIVFNNGEESEFGEKVTVKF